jgi:regulator of ribosome biosynthesis
MLLARFPSQYLNLPGTCLTGAQVCMMDVYRLSSFLLFVCRRDTDSYLKDVTRDNIQLLVNEVWKLPTERVDEVVLGLIPPPTTILPREKPVPKPKPPTKWELYVKKKGIQKKKRSRMVFDEKSGEWKPRWGYKRISDSKEDWLLEVPSNADPFEDQFEKKQKDKKERVAKNEYQRLRNIARHEKGIRLQAPLLPSGQSKASKEQLRQSITRAKMSTASAGVFQPTLPKEPAPKHTGRKRKFESVIGDMESERKRALEVFEKIQKKKPVLDASRVCYRHLCSFNFALVYFSCSHGDIPHPPLLVEICVSSLFYAGKFPVFNFYWIIEVLGF